MNPHLELLQLAPPTLKALECGRLRSNRPSSSLRLRLDMVLTRCPETDTAEEYSELRRRGQREQVEEDVVTFQTNLNAREQTLA